MRVTLINPYYPISETPSPPLGLAFLAGALERAGHEVQMLDYVVYPYSKQALQGAMERFQPRMIGVTAVSMTFPDAAQVMADAKAIDPEVVTVLGGPHATFRAEPTLLETPQVDVVVVGEGELTIVELTRAIETGADLAQVAGLVVRGPHGPLRTAARPHIADVDTLPIPARRHIPLGRYRAIGMPISMTTSRGCPFQCIFCVGRKMVGSKVRYHSTKRVVDEFESLTKLGFHQINIADDLFTANKKHCIPICEEIIARGIDYKWTSFARVDTVSPEVLRAMKKAGCTAVSFGVETGNPEIMKRIKKGISLDQVTKAVVMTAEAGLLPHASFILGLPGETPQTLRQTQEFADSLAELGCLYGFHLLAPFPGTEVLERIDEYGLTLLTDNWADYHANRAIVQTAQAPREMLDEVVIRYDKEYVAALGEMKRKLQAGQASQDEAAQVLGLDRICATHDIMMGRMLETDGFVAAGDLAADNAGGLATLARRLAARLKFSEAEVQDALEHNLRHQTIQRADEPGGVRWSWINYAA